MSENKGLSSRAIIGSFYQRLEQMDGMSWFNPISMYFESDQESETYKWLGMSPAMREWIGGRNAKGFRENGITIRNLEFEATLEVPRRWLMRDKTGQLMVRVNEMADRAVAHWGSLISTLILNGGTGVCYDGQYFFDTDHAEGDSGTQSNDITVDISAAPVSTHGSTTAPSVEEFQYSVLQGVQAIMGFKDDQGEPMNETAREFQVQVPTSLWHVATAACRNPVMASGQSNLITNLSEMSIVPAVNPRLTWTDKFGIFRTDGSVKPFIRQEEEGVVVEAIAEGSELAFEKKVHQYGISASRNVGYGYWQQAARVTLG